MIFILWMVGLMVVTEVLFAVIMTVKAKIAGKPKWVVYSADVIFAIPVVIGLICDALVNYLPASIICLQLPRWKEWLTTWRLHRYVNTVPIPTKGLPLWRFRVAIFVCNDMLNPFQWNHCGEPRDVLLGKFTILKKPGT